MIWKKEKEKKGREGKRKERKEGMRRGKQARGKRRGGRVRRGEKGRKRNEKRKIVFELFSLSFLVSVYNSIARKPTIYLFFY